MKKPLLIFGLSFLLMSCIAERKFDVGQYVTSKLSGQKGMVIEAPCYLNGAPCRYNVRFVSLEILTRTHTISSDEPVKFSPFSVVNMAYYELEDYVEEK